MSNSVSIQSLKEYEEANWSVVLAKAFKDPVQLLRFLHLDEDMYLKQLKSDSQFKMLVPLSYAKKMKKRDWGDPLLRQVLPLEQEDILTEGFGADPVGDLNAEISSGLLQKYQGRVLLVTTGACPVHCRYCFRREFPYSQSNPDKKQWQTTLSNIEKDKSINEVILSGGDPLMLSDKRLSYMCDDLSQIQHIKTIRFHSRVPVFLPERITIDFLAWLENLSFQKVMVIHSNHANEIDDKVRDGLISLRAAGVTVLNQTVLLKGVNDSVDVLSALSKRLFEFQVLPYYLHQLDRVQGTAHFEVDRAEAIELLRSLKNQLPGYLVPRLVEEISGKRSKQGIE